MNESVALVGGPELTRSSLIFTGLAFRTFSVVAPDFFVQIAWFVHDALPTKSPLKATGPDVTLNVALTLAPGATGPGKVFAVSELPATTADHCCGTERLNLTPAAGAPVVFMKVTVVSCDEPGENVCSPAGLVVSEASVTLTGKTP